MSWRVVGASTKNGGRIRDRERWGTNQRWRESEQRDERGECIREREREGGAGAKERERGEWAVPPCDPLAW